MDIRLTPRPDIQRFCEAYARMVSTGYWFLKFILICMYSDYRLFEIEPSGIQNVGVIFALYRMFTNVQ